MRLAFRERLAYARAMAKPAYIEIGDGRRFMRIPILYEDRSVLVIDKPAGWMLAPMSWQNTARNLQAAVESSLRAGDFWAKSRNLRFLRFVHRLDADTSGVLLWVKSQGAVAAYSQLFEDRQIEKVYWAVVRGVPRETEWTCRDPLSPDPTREGRMIIDPKTGQEAETQFRTLWTGTDRSLVEARPRTGRTHQIRVHLAAAGCPVMGDDLYRGQLPYLAPNQDFPLGLRAMELAYPDPFTKRKIFIKARGEAFLKAFGVQLPPPQKPVAKKAAP